MNDNPLYAYALLGRSGQDSTLIGIYTNVREAQDAQDFVDMTPFDRTDIDVHKLNYLKGRDDD